MAMFCSVSGLLSICCRTMTRFGFPVTICSTGARGGMVGCRGVGGMGGGLLHTLLSDLGSPCSLCLHLPIGTVLVLETSPRNGPPISDFPMLTRGRGERHSRTIHKQPGHLVPYTGSFWHLPRITPTETGSACGRNGQGSQG